MTKHLQPNKRLLSLHWLMSWRHGLSGRSEPQDKKNKKKRLTANTQ
jgi:hypothetical protein